MKVESGNRFRKDYTLAQKRGLNINLLDEIIRQLANGVPLAPKNRDHVLIGDWAGHRECHIAADWVLIYRFVTIQQSTLL